jgi:hypothetical protein
VLTSGSSTPGGFLHTQPTPLQGWVDAFDRPLNQLARSSPSLVMSRYSTSAANTGSTQVALGSLVGFVMR